MAVAVYAILAAAIFITLRQWFFAKQASFEPSEIRKHPLPMWILGIQSYPILPLLVVKVFSFLGDVQLQDVVHLGRG